MQPDLLMALITSQSMLMVACCLASTIQDYSLSLTARMSTACLLPVYCIVACAYCLFVHCLMHVQYTSTLCLLYVYSCLPQAHCNSQRLWSGQANFHVSVGTEALSSWRSLRQRQWLRVLTSASGCQSMPQATMLSQTSTLSFQVHRFNVEDICRSTD